MSKIPKELDKYRHILSLSGGKDSTALALHMKDRIPQMEYVFCDTGEELKETIEYLHRLEAHLGREISFLNPDRPFTYYLDIYKGVLPDPRTRWCTRMLKIRPFEDHVRDDPVILYVGIRADEAQRKGYISTKPNISAKFPFIEDGITRANVFDILEENDLPLPAFYNWKSRSGCYFCFFQQKREWVGLLENQPKYFWKAAEFEKINEETGQRYTWIEGESLEELAKPKRVAAIKMEYEQRIKRNSRHIPNQKLIEILTQAEGQMGSVSVHSFQI
jgi:3'-phosphoadenosine 5'-phosphosulfate sulfotransferase (PAPS reductase)/FAD synthetase